MVTPFSKQGNCLEKEIMQGTMPGARRQGRLRTARDRQHQVVDRTLCGRVNQNDRIEINGESTSMVWPTLGSRTTKEQNRTRYSRLSTGCIVFTNFNRLSNRFDNRLYRVNGALWTAAVYLYILNAVRYP